MTGGPMAFPQQKLRSDGMRRWTVFAVGLALLLSAAWRADGQQPAETVTVSQTFNNAPFDYQVRLLAERADFRVYRLTYPSPVVTSLAQNNTIPADLYLPKCVQAGGPKYPAVICLPILDGNEPLTELLCSVLASRCVPAISFKLPYYGQRGLANGPRVLADDPKLFVSAIAQAGQDIRRTIDLLGSRPEINRQRIGITGISLGGIIAATAAGAEPRLYRAGLMLAGGDLIEIIHHARETRPLSAMIRRLPPAQRADLEAKLAAVDPLRFAPALRGRAEAGRVLMINAGQDEGIPRQCTEKLAGALGIDNRVTWLDGLGHYTAMAELPRALRMMADFFAQDLPEGVASPKRRDAVLGTEVPSPSGRRDSALQLCVAMMQQAVAMLSAEPEQGRGHFLDLELSAAGQDERPIGGRICFAHGAEGRFSLQCRLPEIGELAVGQGRCPWMVANRNSVLAGTKNPVAGLRALSYVDPRHQLKLRLAAGAIGAIALAPTVLEQWLRVGDDAAAAGGRAVRIGSEDQHAFPANARLSFANDGRTPTEANFDVLGIRGKLVFHAWRPNASSVESSFDPPADLPREDVDQAGLCRAIALMVNAAIGRMN
jgi:dienelactone hydrolase